MDQGHPDLARLARLRGAAWIDPALHTSADDLEIPPPPAAWRPSAPAAQWSWTIAAGWLLVGAGLGWTAVIFTFRILAPAFGAAWEMAARLLAPGGAP